MLKRFLPVCLLVPAMMAVAGCTDPIQPDQDTFSPYPQIYLSGYGLKNDILVKMDQPQRIPGTGQLQVEITIRNKSWGDLTLDYKYYFTDAKGVPIERETSWQGVRINKGGIETIRFTSLTASAADFRVEVRPQKYE